MYFVYVVREKRHTELFTRASSWMTVVDNGGISMMQWSEHSPSTAVHYVLFLLLSYLLSRFFKGLFSFPFSVVTNIRNFDLAHFNKYWQNFRVMKQIVITLIRSINCQTIVGIWWHFSSTFPKSGFPIIYVEPEKGILFGAASQLNSLMERTHTPFPAPFTAVRRCSQLWQSDQYLCLWVIDSISTASWVLYTLRFTYNLPSAAHLMRGEHDVATAAAYLDATWVFWLVKKHIRTADLMA